MEDLREFALTTIDNPYNFYDQPDLWRLYDIEKNHNTCELLARFAETSEQFTDQENRIEINKAIDWIINNDPTGLYIKQERKNSSFGSRQIV